MFFFMFKDITYYVDDHNSIRMSKLGISYESLVFGNVGLSAFEFVFKCARVVIGILSNSTQVGAYFTYVTNYISRM